MDSDGQHSVLTNGKRRALNGINAVVRFQRRWHTFSNRGWPKYLDLCERKKLVELRGFEPLTSSMPWKRATNCAIAPSGLLNITDSPDAWQITVRRRRSRTGRTRSQTDLARLRIGLSLKDRPHCVGVRTSSDLPTPTL